MGELDSEEGRRWATLVRHWTGRGCGISPAGGDVVGDAPGDRTRTSPTNTVAPAKGQIDYGSSSDSGAE